MLGLLLDEGASREDWREVGYRGYVLQGKVEGDAFFLPGFPTGGEEGQVRDLAVGTARPSPIDDTAA